jgi:hypothetical protein
MNYKYLGEAVALLGIAYSIVRWLARNAPDADARPRPGTKITLGRFGLPREVEIKRAPVIPSDPHMLTAAARAFGIAPETLAQMDQRERALLVSAYASTHPPAVGDETPGRG